MTLIANDKHFDLQLLNGCNKLVIRNADTDDNNVYTCRLEYPAHDIAPVELQYDLDVESLKHSVKDDLIEQRNTSLLKLKTEISGQNYYRDFKRKPIFSTLLTNRSAVADSTVRLIVTAIGVDCNVVWSKNNRPIQNNGKFNCTFNPESGVAVLEINDVQLDDSGEYTCVVANGFGENSTSSRLKVYEGVQKSPLSPTFTRSIKGSTLTYIQIHFNCSKLFFPPFCTFFLVYLLK